MSRMTVWRTLSMSQLREQPGRLLVTLLAVALGVALFSGVYLVNAGALDEFGQATRRLIGEADLIVRGPRTGFPESVFVDLARSAEVRLASPVLELEVALPRERASLKILGLDPLRASMMQPTLVGELSGRFLELFAADGIFLSVSAAADLRVRRGDRFDVIVGNRRRSLEVLGILSDAAYPQRMGIMDIASAQWTLERLGTINRVDLRLQPGTDVDAFRESLARRLPAGLLATAPEIEQARAASISRSYRVNLNMLALVSLLTGSFLVFATQALSMLRRRTSLALLRALGVTRGQLQRALFGEGVLLGAVGSAIGIAVGYLLAGIVLEAFRGDFGSGQLRIGGAGLRAEPMAIAAFFCTGTIIASLGAWVPARDAARRAPALALKAGDAETALAELRPSALGLILTALGAALAWLPAIGGMPLFGYASVAALLFGAVLLVPACASWLLERAPASGRPALDIGLAQLRGSVSQITVSLAAVIVSFSLMVAMAIMVHSFRESFEVWLGKQLPADVQLRVSGGNDTRFLSPAEQRKLESLPGVRSVEFRRQSQLALAADRAPVALIARDRTPSADDEVLPLVAGVTASAADTLEPAWISEAMQDLYGWRIGQRVFLPLAGQRVPVHVTSVFRDYGRSTGAIVIARAFYRRHTGDHNASEASLWLTGDRDADDIVSRIRATLADGESLEVRTSTEVRELSLRAFDRAFLVTYALESVAVLIGLLGVAFAGASTALARRSEFGMLRHVGMLRRQIVAMLAGEGFLMSALGVAYGLVLGAALSLVLVYVINRQSFSWSIDLAVPWLQLFALSAALMIAATVTNVISGRAALRADALRAVREDW
jgi:putative ABC transport system permease protein